VVVEDVTEIEVALVPVEPGASQKLPQPAKNGAAVTKSRIAVFPLQIGMCFIMRPSRSVGI
jgi:hypothetical protein